ncbi:alkaline phosphatase D family protein [Bacillus sp. V3B]|uniref:alkaline phosphatase D family protein n=1 Tax=Bacillus sp. V3B TaxID=2804915 RepID=UPI002109D632|nr:alkaline phosphatase D family protein [Bacillus sp. V3B]MCQ6277106.1 alkaline phosphatase D family protein [Bacillus sp. V3B]
MKEVDKNRRNFLKNTGKGVGVALGVTIANSLPVNFASAAESNKLQYPFTLGIASGDPLPDGVVLWTRLAPDPLNGGGMDHHPFPVQWEVSLDSKFQNVVKRGTELSKPQLGHSVHVEVEGLNPSTWYYYRFKAGSEMSPTGKTKTAPAYNSQVDHLKFAFASCQNWSAGFYTAYQHMAKDDLDLVVHLGDYIYEGKHDSTIRPMNQVYPEIYTIDDYRNRYALYKLDSDLQAAHANFPWIVTFDDHEVDNNWAGEIPQDPKKQSKKDFLARRSIAFQAYYEHMPLRRTSLPNGGSIQLFRRLSFGNLVDFNVLDTRQFRDDQANGDGWKVPTPESEDPTRTMLGEQQEHWLLDGLDTSQAKWKVLAQQVFFARRDYDFDPEEEYVSMDAWDGYPGSRQRILDHLAEKNIMNTVVLTGDVHTNWANEVKANFDDENSENVAVEFVGTSISSNGDGSDVNNNTAQILQENPHIKFFNNHRGYVRCKLTQQTWQTDYMVIPYVSRPGAPISTRASFVVENGKSSLKQLTAKPL